jgi:hypothetical protein
MQTTTAIIFGAALGLLVAALSMLLALARYVSSDLDGFRRWLDKGGVL